MSYPFDWKLFLLFPTHLFKSLPNYLFCDFGVSSISSLWRHHYYFIYSNSLSRFFLTSWTCSTLVLDFQVIEAVPCRMRRFFSWDRFHGLGYFSDLHVRSTDYLLSKARGSRYSNSEAACLHLLKILNFKLLLLMQCLS